MTTTAPHRRVPVRTGPCRVVWLVTVVLAVLALGACTGDPAPPADPEPGLPDVSSMTTALWDETLSGAAPLDAAALARLNDPADAGLGDAAVGESAAGAARVASEVVVASVAGTDRDRFADVLTPGSGPWCTDAKVHAASPARLPQTPAGEFVLVQVVWSATCPFAPTAPSPSPGLFLSEVVLAETGDGWVPVLLPRWPATSGSALAAGDPRLSPLGCATAGSSARTEVALAWDEACQAASAEGVTLVATDGWRSADDQALRFAEAVAYFGSVEAASRHVAAPEDGACMSRHCAGAAIDVAAGDSFVWMTRQVGCADLDGTVTATSEPCPAGTSPVRNAARFGFAQPYADNPTHFEYVGPLAEASSCASSAASVPETIASVWRCRLVSSGLSDADTDRAVAQALAVSRCASGWDPAARAFGGRFATEPNPADGRTYPGVGLFLMSPDTTAAMLSGVAPFDLPPQQAASASAQADAAVRLWLSERDAGRWGWGPFVCASPGSEQNVLPDGDATVLPDWATSF